MDDNERYERAKKRVADLKRFYRHLIVYLVITTFLLLIDLLTPNDRLWFYWPALGWGVAVALHGLSVFGGMLFSREWEERKIRQIMERDART